MDHEENKPLELVDENLIPFNRSEETGNEEISEPFFYTIIAPKSFRANSDFCVSVNIHDAKDEFDEPVVVRISIEDEDDDAGMKVYRDIEMKRDCSEIVSIPVGNVNSNYKFVVKGISGIIFEREASLDSQQQTYAILIQTDKAIYKPNDCVKFRVLVLDSELKPAIIEKNGLKIGFTVS